MSPVLGLEQFLSLEIPPLPNKDLFDWFPACQKYGKKTFDSDQILIAFTSPIVIKV